MTVTINLKTFVDELYIAVNSGNEDEVKELEEKFTHYYTTHSKEVLSKSIVYIRKLKFYEDKKVKIFFDKFPM